MGRVKPFLNFFVLVALAVCVGIARAAPVNITVLAVVGAGIDEDVGAFRAAVAVANADAATNAVVRLNAVVVRGAGSPIDSMIAFCEASGLPFANVVVGPSFSRDALLIAALTGRMGLPTLAYSATASALNDPSAFPTLLRSVASDGLTARAVVALLKSFGFRR